ncbi:MAG: hypothetical protein M1829_003702 [Trizodia sp. TS-e1964]|nr:MAG: hypothetical protein M1829_003702 [Trizodia sp. TS-e1964]
MDILERLLDDFPGFEAQIFVEEEDPNLSEANGRLQNLGANPKVRNMSRAYREAKGDALWIIDCNVWVGKGVVGRMVDKLYGLGVGEFRKYKFVHLLPLVIDIDERHAHFTNGLLLRGEDDEGESRQRSSSPLPKALRIGGGRLEELFLSSSHAKFYTAINTVAVAPCIVGKSTMFRRSHLNQLTENHPSRPSGIDFFSENICEDHLIGDLLWHGSFPAEPSTGKSLSWGKHGLVFGDLAIQPLAGMSVSDYIARRVRWLRVRKFTVILATLVEPGTESLLCSLYGACGVTTLPIFYRVLGIPPTWLSFFLFFFTSITLWAFVDWNLYLRLHAGDSTEVDSATPGFARRIKGARRPFLEWLAAWIVRELLACPIWVWAVFGGTTVVWRGRKMWVGFDMKVHKVNEPGKARID